MTRPDGEAFIDVHANTKPYDRELETGVRKASADADDLLDAVGKDWGDTLAESTSKELGKHGRDFADSIERGISHEVVHIRGKRYVIDRRGRLHDAAGRFVKAFEDEVEDAFLRSAGGGAGNVFNRIGTAISDAIGSGFNVSGKSPLIAFLVPLVGVIVGLVIGAIQAVNILIALLTTLPALIASIGLQVGVLFIAFKGLGTAISGAFAAKNAEELQEALKGLTPEAQTFVKSLLPLKDLFKSIQRVVQSNFFRAMGDPLSFLRFLSPTLISGFGMLATSMGRFFRDLGVFFNSPTFITFVRDIFPATARWIQTFGPAFIKILGALIGAADQAIPFLEHVGMFISLNLASLARRLNDMIRSGGFQQWLAGMERSFELFGGFLLDALRLVGVLMSVLNQEGADEIFKAFQDAFQQLAFFLASPAGRQALEGLINAAIISIKVFTGLLEIILLILAAIETVGEALNELWKWLTTIAFPAIGDFFSWLGGAIADFFAGIVGHLAPVGSAIRATFGSITSGIRANLDQAIAFVTSLPGRTRAAVGNLDNLLYNAGRSMIQGFINGIRSKLGDLANIAKNAIHTVTDWFPGSPAKEGPLSGQGYSLLRGERMAQDFGAGMRRGFSGLRDSLSTDLGGLVDMLTPSNTTTNGVVFGPGSVKVTFEGVVPTEDEARRTGRAVGAGISDQLARRNTVLAVRTL